MNAPRPNAYAAALDDMPPLTKRGLAYLVDSLVSGVLGFFIGLFVGPLGPVASAGYMLLRDGADLSFMHHRSLGKRLLNLHVYRLDGRPMDLETSLRRNWTVALGSLTPVAFGLGLGNVVSIAAVLLVVYEIYRVVTRPDGRRWGDEFADTQVTDASGTERPASEPEL